MAAIHAAEGGTDTHAGIGAVNGAAETFVCTGTGTGVHVSARASECAGRCTGVKVGGDLVEPRGIKLGDNV